MANRFNINLNRDFKINKVAKAVTDGRLVLFIGSGLSNNLALGTWGDLMDSLVDNVQDVVPNKDKEEVGNNAKLLCSLNYFPLAAEYLYRKSKDNHQPNLVNNCVKDFYSETSKTHRLADNSDVYGKIGELFQLGANKVVTTNYDSSLESMLNGKSVNLTKYYYKDINNRLDEVMSSLLGREGCVIKIHGDASADEKLIITESDYEKAYILEDKIPFLLKEVFTHNLVLFIGCSVIHDKYYEILKRLKVEGIRTELYAICLDNEFTDMPEGVVINRIIMKKHDDLVKTLNNIVNEIRQEQRKRFLHATVPLSAYDYESADSFFNSVSNKNSDICIFTNTQVESLDWFTPSLELHLFKQMTAHFKRKKVKQFRVVFLPYSDNSFKENLKREGVKECYSALVEIHNMMECPIAFITEDSFCEIIKKNTNEFKDLSFLKKLGLSPEIKTIIDDAENNDQKIDEQNLKILITKNIMEQGNGYQFHDDLDFSYIAKNDDKQEVWQANFEDGNSKKFRYKMIAGDDSKHYIVLAKILINELLNDDKCIKERYSFNHYNYKP